ncbi:MAG: glycosyltransferase family 4 protein [Anaerolineae bacterium]|nr:glycosyltransferase family 4 protein [Anaerolineae bacterium]
MNILQVTPGYWPEIGGVERHVEALAERLVARGHEVTVATLEPRGQKTGNGARGGAEVLRFPAWGIGDAYRLPQGLAGFIRANRNRWDIVHVHNYHAPLIPLVAFGGGGPFVATTHLNDAPHSAMAGLLHHPYRMLGGAAVRRAEAIVCVTEAERGRVISRLGAEPARTVVIPNGFDPALLKAREGSGVRDPFLMLSVGRLQAYKRVAAALRSLSLLDERHQLAIVGDGPQREELTALAAELGLANRVTFAGRASDGELIEWYRRAGTVISLSAAEAFGMTVLEGVAAGAQVVASDIPAFRDLARLFPGQVVTVDAEAPEQVAQAVRQAAVRTGNAPADVSAFTWDAVTDRLIETYRGALGQARRAGVTNGERKREDGPRVSDARTGAE